MKAKPFTEEELKKLITEDPHNDTCVNPIDCDWCRLVATIDELKETNRGLFKDVLTLKKNLGDYTELIVSDVKQKERIKELEIKLAHSLKTKQREV